MRDDATWADTAMLLSLHWQAATLLAHLQRSGAAGDLSFNELRVIHALTTRGAATATTLGVRLCIDAGYLSRIVRRLIAFRMVRCGVPRRDADRRNKPLTTTRAGRRALARYERDASRCLQCLRSSAEE